jgi:hypothetical protein
MPACSSHIESCWLISLELVRTIADSEVRWSMFAVASKDMNTNNDLVSTLS